MLVLSGGTGTPKLLQGLIRVVPPGDITVVVNTAEDLWISGNLVCPDIDSLLYALSGRIDTRRWWGIRGDTFTTHTTLKGLGHDEVLALGDRDRATHILRSEALRQGATLTEATALLARRMGVRVRVLPMCEEPVATLIRTPRGWVHFQEFWVARRGRPRALGVRYEGSRGARPTREVLRALRDHPRILIGPSNPITSIGPILSLLRPHIRGHRAVAVSPFLGNRTFSGPAGKLMRATGYPASSRGVAECYQGLVDTLLVDPTDPYRGDDRVRAVAAPIRMKNTGDAVRLARRVLPELDR